MRNPKASRPLFPKDYGVDTSPDKMLSWAHVDEKMTSALNYWVGSVRPGGQPHSVPVWGVWLDNTFYFDGGPTTRHARNIKENPQINVHLESGDQVVIVEGECQLDPNLDDAFLRRIADAYGAKYAGKGYTPEPSIWKGVGIFVLKPRSVIAWTNFLVDPTKWRF